MLHNKMTRARTLLILEHPFFASLLLPMPMSENPSIPTMATDGASILYNPEWVESLSLEEVTFVLAHEVLHCVYDHMGRRGERGPNRWNQAADYVINEMLVNERKSCGAKAFPAMPKGGLLDASLVKRGGGTAEGVYALLPIENEKKKPGESGGSLDEMHDAGSENGTKPVDAAAKSQASADIKVRVIQAKNAAKMQGKLSAGLERLINDVLKPKVDWREELRKYLSERAKIDFSFAKPKRRFLGEDLYLPSLVGEKIGALVIAVDCSGSTWHSPKLIEAFTAEINAIKEDLKPSRLDLVYFDSKVVHVDTIAHDDDLAIKPRGGGGTAFSPVIDHVNAMSDTPTCVIFLTDLECDDFGDAPEYPVLFCVIGGRNRKTPYGECIEVDDNEKS